MVPYFLHIIPVRHDAMFDGIFESGYPVAIVTSLSEYQRLISPNLRFGAALVEFRQKYQIQDLDINPDEVFEDVRDRTFGREVIF